MPNEPLYLLLADDDEDNRLFFEEAVEALDMQTLVFSVKDGQELMMYLAKAKPKLPDLFFADFLMPRNTGLQSLIEIRNRSQLKDIPVAIYSTSTSLQDFERTYVNGADMPLVKPSTFNELKKLLSKVIHLLWQSPEASLERDNFVLS